MLIAITMWPYLKIVSELTLAVIGGAMAAPAKENAVIILIFEPTLI